MFAIEKQIVEPKMAKNFSEAWIRMTDVGADDSLAGPEFCFQFIWLHNAKALYGSARTTLAHAAGS